MLKCLSQMNTKPKDNGAPDLSSADEKPDQADTDTKEPIVNTEDKPRRWIFKQKDYDPYGDVLA